MSKILAYFVLNIQIMKKIVALILMIFSLTLSSVFADVFDEVQEAFKTSEPKQISAFFDTSIDFKIGDNSSTYSKNQAEMVLRDFYDKTKPQNFTIVHKGASNRGTRYCLANVDTEKGKYRFYIYIKESGSSFLITELNFEKI